MDSLNFLELLHRWWEINIEIAKRLWWLYLILLIIFALYFVWPDLPWRKD